MSTATPRSLPGHARDPLEDRLAIIELTSSMGLRVDSRDWTGLEELFAPRVEVDYTSLNGGEPQTVNPAQLIGGWRSVLEQLDATQHLIASQVIALDGDHATCTANVQGTHVLGNPTGGSTWTVAGQYAFALERADGQWRISALTLTVTWASGNQRIMDLAAQASADSHDP
jgi:hypothetical protein